MNTLLDRVKVYLESPSIFLKLLKYTQALLKICNGKMVLWWDQDKKNPHLRSFWKKNFRGLIDLWDARWLKYIGSKEIVATFWPYVATYPWIYRVEIYINSDTLSLWFLLQLLHWCLILRTCLFNWSCCDPPLCIQWTFYNPVWTPQWPLNN